ncbi:putative ctr copper transporter family protein [Botrytis cinerea BcDW1]|nr:putative ctr copper transporter family protein [Botrytis cinerea BcDW1]
MGTSSMDMGGAMATATATGTMAAESTAAAMDMGGGCQISMLWNWYTIDSCFISSTWKITSNGMFAGSCIGVILLVMSLEFLRRASREYDRYIVRQARNQLQHITSDVAIAIDPKINGPGPDSTQTVVTSQNNTQTFRPHLLQQTIRAFFHMMQFAVAYFVMLLAMYYNGYIIISIIIGAFLGAFVFSWEPIDLRPNVNEEATVCCG